MKKTAFIIKKGRKYFEYYGDGEYYLFTSIEYAKDRTIDHKIKDYKVYKLEITESIVDISVPEK